jgi:hypothetical protein
MTWNKADLRPRVEARLKALGKTLDDVLPGYAIFAPSYVDHSPTMAILEKLATGLGWSLCELLCDSRATLIELAVTLALRAVPSDRDAKLAAATVSALDMLEAYERDRQPIDETALAHIERSLRALYKNR